MQKLDLTLSQELNDLESQILARAVNHSSYVHQRAIAYVLGVSFISIGVGMLGINFTQEVGCLLAFAAIVAGATLQCAVFGFMMVPCPCGKTPVVTAQCRSHLVRKHSKGYFSLLLLACIAVGLAWNFSVFGMIGSVGLSLGASAMMMIAIQCFQSTGIFVLGLGLVTFGSAVRNKTEWLNTNHVIPELEVRKVAQLSEETPEELHSLIDFHLKAGNMVSADRLSQKLLTVVESHTHT